MLGGERGLQLLDLVYAAALQPARWPEALAALSDLFHGHSTLFSQDDRRPGVNVAAWARFEPQALQAYSDHYGAINPWMAKVGDAAAGTLAVGHRLIRDSELMRTEFYDGWLKPQGLRDTLGCVLQRSEGVATNVTVVRDAAAGAPGEAEIALWTELMPHVRRALDMHRRLFVAEAEAASAEDLLARAGLGLVLADAVGRALFANEAAQRRFGPGRGLDVRAGRLAAEDGAADRRLRRLVYACARTAGGRGSAAGGVVTLPRRDARPLMLLVCPFRGQGLAGGAPAALVFIHAPEDAPVAPEAALARLWGLTPAEARLAGALAGGRRLSDWADERGVAYATARAHLARVLRKAEARSQAELVRLALASPPIAWPPAPR